MKLLFPADEAEIGPEICIEWEEIDPVEIGQGKITERGRNLSGVIEFRSARRA